MKILLVEDHEKLRDELCSLIMRLGHEVVEATDGREASELLFGDSDVLDPSFNAVITDMKMPHMSGLGLLQFLDERRVNLPCLLHSSEDTADGINLADVEDVFDFATFHLKGEVRYIKEFLSSIPLSAAKAAE